MDKDLFRDIALCALQDAIEPDYDAFHRKVCRWFSEKYSTPLLQVEEMADEYLLRHYLEETYVGIVAEATRLGAPDDAGIAAARKRLDEIKANLLAEENGAAEMSEDEYWEKELAKEFEASAAEDAASPNLEKKHEDISIKADDEIPED